MYLFWCFCQCTTDNFCRRRSESDHQAGEDRSMARTETRIPVDQRDHATDRHGPENDPQTFGSRSHGQNRNVHGHPPKASWPPFAAFEALLGEHNDVSAIIAEPLQQIIPADPGYLHSEMDGRRLPLPEHGSSPGAAAGRSAQAGGMTSVPFGPSIFARVKRILGLGRLRLRGRCGVQNEFALAAIAQNLWKLAKLKPMATAAGS